MRWFTKRMPGLTRRRRAKRQKPEPEPPVPGARLARHPQAFTTKAGTGPTRRSFPVFELPDRVLDLDAEDSPHVRPFDEESDGASQALKWGHDPSVPGLREQVTALRRRMKQDQRAMGSRAATPFAPSHVSDHDVMKVLLFGGASVSDALQFDASRPHPLAKYGSELRVGLRRVGIPTGILALPANAVVAFMLHRQQLAAAALKDPSLRRTPDDAEAFRAGLRECRDVHRVGQLCSRIDSPSSGVDISAEFIDHVHDRLLAILKAGYRRSHPEAILKFVNNLTIKRLSGGKDLNRSMTLLGLQLASALGVLPSILQYLQMTLSMGFMNESDEATSLTRLQTGRAILAALERGEGRARGTRQQIFTLLTGMSWGSPGPQPSLLGLDAEDRWHRPDTFDLRLRLLGELGAVRLLWHQRHRGHDDHLLSMALIRGAQVLSTLEGGALGMNWTATGDVGRDAALDWETINAVDAAHTSSGAEMPKPSLSRFEKDELAPQIKEALGHPDLSQGIAHFKEAVDRHWARLGITTRNEAVAEEETPTSKTSTAKETDTVH